MEYVIKFGEVNYIADVIKIFFLISYTYCVSLKINNKKIPIKINIIAFTIFVLLAIINKAMKDIFGYFYSIIYLDFLLGVVFSKTTKNNIGFSIIITTISLSINYILFLMSIILSFVPNAIFKINNSFLSLATIVLIYSILVYGFLKIKKFSKGITFLQEKLKGEYLDIIILNISIIILFCITLLSNYEEIVTSNFGISIIIFSIIMFITIQKSLQLYYKQKLQERETNDIKEELKNKDKEIEELEKENLRLNKTNHSIAHKQKSLEYELNQLLLKNEIVEENNIKSKLETISKEIQNENTAIEIDKTNIPEIDNMLKYMQSECIKNKIDFELQINGNIHHMVNQYIQKSDLEILLADHIKNAIIAINHSENINKNILVRLGLIDGFYSVYIYDSGIEFEIKTLINLGIKPSTTHEKDGGTGMGFMNTFDTLRKYKASLVIHEYGKPSKDNFTKLIKVIFDNQNEYKISSYRKEDIQKQDIEKRVSF